MCQPRIPGSVGAEPFSAKIRYTGPDDPDFPNLIKLTVTMPHMDGDYYTFVANHYSLSSLPNNQKLIKYLTFNRHVTSHLHKTPVKL